MKIEGILTEQEIELGRQAVTLSLEGGAQQVRVTLNKSMMDQFATLDGEMDKVSHCMDRSININLYVDGRYGTFSSNRFESRSLEAFILKAIDTVRMLEADEFRKLADPSRIEKGASDGKELGLFDPAYADMDATRRRQIALSAAGFKRENQSYDGFKVISEEGEYSDSIFDTVVLDSNGTFCRHTETSFEYGVEVTIQDEAGNKNSGYWWEAAPTIAEFDPSGCYDTAVRRAGMKLNPKGKRSGSYSMVVSTDCASRLLTPVLNALSAFALQQNNSFLIDSLGKKIFHEGMTVTDRCRECGKTGSRLFDSEGVATSTLPIIENGVVRTYFVNTYMAGKMGIDPTIEDVTRPAVSKWLSPELGDCPDRLDAEAIMRKLGSGILVTGFNGGNSNSSTGDFSYGIEGFAFKNGKITHPVKEMVMTGNFIDLWNRLAAAGDDYRDCASRRVPTLAFREVDFSA